MMDRFASMLSFRTVVERGGFGAAAKALGLSKATVSKQVTALEAHLGAALLQRTTRRLSMTEAGQGFYADTVRILDDVAGAEGNATEGHGEPRGLLRINAPLSFGVARLMPVAARLMATHPAIRIDLALDDRAIDPVGGAFDITLRIRRALDDSELVARRIGPITHVLCAARHYPPALPERPEEVSEHRMLVYGADGVRARQYRFEAGEGRGLRTADVRVTPVLKTNSSLAIREALLAGAGIAVIPRFVVEADIAAGRLVTLLDGWRLPEHALFAIFTGGPTPPAKVRRFLELLVERRDDLTDNPGKA